MVEKSTHTLETKEKHTTDKSRQVHVANSEQQVTVTSHFESDSIDKLHKVANDLLTKSKPMKARQGVH